MPGFIPAYHKMGSSNKKLEIPPHEPLLCQNMRQGEDTGPFFACIRLSLCSLLFALSKEHDVKGKLCICVHVSECESQFCLAVLIPFSLNPTWAQEAASWAVPGEPEAEVSLPGGTCSTKITAHPAIPYHLGQHLI